MTEGRAPERHVVATGGGGFSMEPDNPLLDDFVLGLAAGRDGRADETTLLSRCFGA